MAEPLKSRSDFSTDSEWYTYMVTHPEEFDEVDEEEKDKEKNKEYQKAIFVCEKCGNIIDETDKYFDKVQNKNIKRDEKGNILKCPKCGADQSKLKKITKEKKEELVKKKKRKEEKEEEKLLRIAKENIKDDILDLLEDLSKRLEVGELDVNRFVVVFFNLSWNIVKRYSKDLEIDWIDYRKSMLQLSKTVTDLYDTKIDAEEILEEYNEDISKDSLYLAELNYYINDDKYSIADYEMQERIKEYEAMESSMFKKEREKELEERYQQRRIELEKKADLREQRRIERAIS